MSSRVQLVAIVAIALLFVIVFELVRRRRLMERYALLWLFSTVVLLGLAVWQSALTRVAEALGIFYAPSALFVIAFGFVLAMLLHFSLVISRLSDQSKVLAQQVGMLSERLAAAERKTADEQPAADGVKQTLRSGRSDLTPAR